MLFFLTAVSNVSRKFGCGGGGTLVAMTKKKTPQILKTDTAQKLAEKWVANMSTPAEDDPIEAQQEARPPRLGLGAKVSRQMKRRPSDDPLDQNYKPIEAECAGSSKKAGDESEDDDDDESESKSQAFGKKRQNKSTPR
ncbi:hypothetical protein Bca52824_078103 [Brassica carinata]|uniref:Uncharacterized protein n=1 Tax=Brassica carinata TaxID=52824 RepID=A0A8X7TYU9_BRACI|nr:hypothetical protein Bca52824_078103 [Brassica carinata]